MKNNRHILRSIKSIKNLEKIDTKYGIYASTPDFYIRVLDYISDPKYPLPEGEKRWRVQFAYRPTFNKWGDSTNFETEIHYDPKKNQRFMDGARRKQYVIPDLNMELAWCKKVAESGLFHYNTYFATIKTPWFIYPEHQQPYDFIEKYKKER